MIRRALLRMAAAPAAALLAASAFAAFAPDLDRAVAAPGLQRVDARSIDVAYQRPGASLARYNAILVEPVAVAFRRNWQPQRTGSNIRLSEQERDQLRAGVADAVQRAFAQELQQGELKLADKPGPGVLRVSPRLVEVFLTDTGIPTPAPRRVMTANSGEATLIAELSDSVSGEVLARLGDREELRPSVRVVREATPRRITGDLEAAGLAWGRAVREFVAGATAR